MLQKITFIFFVFFLFSGGSQTPTILHKSLGGNQDNYFDALNDKNSPVSKTNLGLPPTIFVKKAVIDSIISLNDSTVVVVTSVKVVEGFDFSPNIVYDSDSSFYVCTDSMIQKSLTYDQTGEWKPGRDTLINHAIFNSKLTCDEIRSELNNFQLGYYQIQNIVFIGYDCSKNQKKKTFYFFFNHIQPPHFFIFLLAFISVLYFFWLNNKNKKASFV